MATTGGLPRHGGGGGVGYCRSVFSLFCLVACCRVWRDTFCVDPCPGEVEVGLSYGWSSTHLIYVHVLNLSAEDKNVQTGYTVSVEGKSRMRRGSSIKLQSNKT